ncbi:MAG: sulfurtransferase [Gammaproteobacteria bacterium]|nr:sulfurtransferase [Gammaproteobacteria bacterium]
MKKFLILSAIIFTFIGNIAFAVDASVLTKKWMHTPFGLYLNPQEAYDLKASSPESIVFLDVRNEAELHYTGMPSSADVNIPYRFETNNWKMKKNGIYGTFKRPKNEYFVPAIENYLKAKNLTKNNPVIIMCSTGSRAPFAAKALHKAGFTKVYTQIEGFEGSRAKSGPNKGKRVVEGWKLAGLPWSYDLEPQKMYFNYAEKSQSKD